MAPLAPLPLQACPSDRPAKAYALRSGARPIDDGPRHFAPRKELFPTYARRENGFLFSQKAESREGAPRLLPCFSLILVLDKKL